MRGAGTIYFRADHDLVGRVLSAKHRARLTPLPEPAEPMMAEAYQMEQDDARPQVSECARLALLAEKVGAAFAGLFTFTFAAAAVISLAMGSHP